MNGTIWKYILRIENTQSVQMPKHAVLLSVGMQADKLCLWALVHPGGKQEHREIYIAGTGHPAHARTMERYNFIGTAIDEGLGLVWHVFDGGPIQ